MSPVGMDSSPVRGILKNGPPADSTGGDSYLFCNVPEHHDLEDYIAELQDKIKKLKLRVSKEKELHEISIQQDDRKAVKRLLLELEDRRDELEGLDLAIERQKKNLWDMRYTEKDLKLDNREARSELQALKKNNERRMFKKLRRKADENSFDEMMEINHQSYLKSEVECLQKTLAKRQAQLRDAERELKDCNHKIRDAKEEARSMVKQYDDAHGNLQQARQEHDVIEKRANDIGVELVKASEQLVILKTDVKDFSKKRHTQDKLLREINNVIAKKDSQFKDIDSKLKYANQSLQTVQAEVAVHTAREKEMVSALQDSEDVIAKRRAEIQKMRDQIEQNRQELERLDQQMGKKKTELQILEDSHLRKEQEFSNVLHDAEIEIASKQQAIKDCREEMEQLEGQKNDLTNHIKTKRGELFQLKEEIQQEEEVLQRLSNTVNKNKSELKHTFEMQKLEQTELDSVKAQHAQKLVELERTQRAFLEEKAEYDQLAAEANRKSSDLDRLRQAVDREKSEVEKLTSERQDLDDRIAALTRDREMLNENCHSLDDKLNNMKRNQRVLEEKTEATTSRLEVLETELRLRERQMEESDIQRENMDKEMGGLKNAISHSKSELNTLNETIKEAENQMKSVEQDVRSLCHQRDEAKQELNRLNEQIRDSEASYHDSASQEKHKYQELQDLIKSLTEREREHQEARFSLNKLRKDIEKEEKTLSKLVTKANDDLESVRQELNDRQGELEEMRKEYSQLQADTDEMQINKQKVDKLSKTVTDLEKDLQERNQEKVELAKALTVSYEEVQRLRGETSQFQDSMTKERISLENTIKDMQASLEQTKQSDRLIDDKENQSVAPAKQMIISTSSLSRTAARMEEDRKNNALKERLAEEQDYLRFQLRQQMMRHTETMESTRLKSEETIDCLKRKLNTLQEVLFNTSPDIRAFRDVSRSRSASPSSQISSPYRNRSQSPLNRSGHYFSPRRSRSTERFPSPIFPERDYVM